MLISTPTHSTNGGEKERRKERKDGEREEI
jgi:hypothetical protein